MAARGLAALMTLLAVLVAVVVSTSSCSVDSTRFRLPRVTVVMVLLLVLSSTDTEAVVSSMTTSDTELDPSTTTLGAYVVGRAVLRLERRRAPPSGPALELSGSLASSAAGEVGFLCKRSVSGFLRNDSGHW